MWEDAYKPSYAGGQSEIIMGQAIKKFGWKRSDLVITTKVSKLHTISYRSMGTELKSPSSIGASQTAKS